MTTGATPKQIEQAIDRRVCWVYAVNDPHAPGLQRQRKQIKSEVTLVAAALVPPGSLITSVQRLRRFLTEVADVPPEDLSDDEMLAFFRSEN